MQLSVCFIALHGGPAAHFAALATENSTIYATGAALNKFREKGIAVDYEFSLPDSMEGKEQLARELAQRAISSATVIITDVGHPFDIKLQKALSAYKDKVRLVYYDNPEDYVPGGPEDYSYTAGIVMLLAQGVLFANANLADSDIYKEENIQVEWGDQKRFGIGYYSLEAAEKIAKDRETQLRSKARESFFEENDLQDEGQKIFVYFGGNNTVYHKEAFPAFLNILSEAMHSSDLSPYIIILQQHPDAKKANLDVRKIDQWLEEQGKNAYLPKIYISNFKSDHAQILADVALYYQTSMAPQFALAGIPTIQVGHKVYPDLLVRNDLAPSAIAATMFLKAIEKPIKVSKEKVIESLGIKQDWHERFEAAIKEMAEL